MNHSDGEHGSRRSSASRTSTTSTTAPPWPKRAEPTEPEVPRAKRVHALHRQRSTLVAAAAVAGLFVLVVVLLYKTGRRVTNLVGMAASSAQPAVRLVTEGSPFSGPAGVENGAAQAPAPPAAAAAKDDLVVLPRSGSTGAAPRAKGSAQSPAIFRKPHF